MCPTKGYCVSYCVEGGRTWFQAARVGFPEPTPHSLIKNGGVWWLLDVVGCPTTPKWEGSRRGKHSLLGPPRPKLIVTGIDAAPFFPGIRSTPWTKKVVSLF